MALPPLSFNVPPRQRSVIEDAFGTALAVAATEAIRSPFEKRREKRAVENEMNLARQREKLALESLPERMRLDLNDWRTRMREQSEQELADIPRRMAAKTRGEIESMTALRGVMAEPAAQLLVDRVMSTIGGFSKEDIARDVNLLELGQIDNLLNTGIAAGNLGEERARTGIQRAGLTEVREAGLFPTLTEDDLGLAFINTETGDPLSTIDIQLLKAGVRGQITTAPEFEKYKARALELQRLKQEGKLQQVQFNAKNHQAMINLFTGREAGQALMQAGRSYPFLLWKTPEEQIDLGEPDAVTGWMAGNRDLIEALAASQLNPDMEAVLRAEKSGVAPQLSSRALGYLSLIYYSFGRKHEHPRAQIPDEIPETQLRQLGQTRIQRGAGAGGGQGSITPAVNPLDRPQSVMPTPQGAVFAGLDISAERRNPEYLQLQRDLQTVLRTGPNARQGGLPYDSTLYREMETDWIQSHSSPEKAFQFYHELGVPDAQLRDLFVGDSASKKLALDQRLRDALQVLQNARDAILNK